MQHKSKSLKSDIPASSTEESVPLQCHWVLGDHADNEIQVVSAKRRKIMPVQEHYDDCGDDTSPLILPELTAYENCFLGCESNPDCAPPILEEESDEEDMYNASFFCSHMWGSNALFSREPSHTPQTC